MDIIERKLLETLDRSEGSIRREINQENYSFSIESYKETLHTNEPGIFSSESSGTYSMVNSNH